MTPAEYLARIPPAPRKLVAAARSAIGKALPGATQSIKYGTLAFAIDGHAVIYLAAWKKHYAVYPAYPGLVAALGDALDGVEVRGKTFQFSYAAKVPVRLIARIAKLLRSRHDGLARKAVR